MGDGRFYNLVRRLELYVVPEGDPYHPGEARRIRPIPAAMCERRYETVLRDDPSKPGRKIATKQVLPRTPEQEAWYAQATLVVPLFGGERYPGGEWSFDLGRCRAIRRRGLVRVLAEDSAVR